MVASKIKAAYIIENYERVVNDALLKEHSSKQLTYQFLQKQAEYDELVKQRDALKEIKDSYVDNNIDPADCMSDVTDYLDVDKNRDDP